MGRREGGKGGPDGRRKGGRKDKGRGEERREGRWGKEEGGKRKNGRTGRREGGKESREGEVGASLLLRPWLWTVRWASKLVEGGWG